MHLSSFYTRIPAKTLYSKMHIQWWTCYIIGMPSGGLVPKRSSNHNITSVLGWRKLTANRRKGGETVEDLRWVVCSSGWEWEGQLLGVQRISWGRIVSSWYVSTYVSTFIFFIFNSNIGYILSTYWIWNTTPARCSMEGMRKGSIF
jgi:hypothetical protein